jgi:hypothetical protein
MYWQSAHRTRLFFDRCRSMDSVLGLIDSGNLGYDRG